MDSMPYSPEEFLDAEQEMSLIARQASQKYKVETNAMFAKLSDVTKLLSKGMVKWGRHQLHLADAVRACLLRHGADGLRGIENRRGKEGLSPVQGYSAAVRRHDSGWMGHQVHSPKDKEALRADGGSPKYVIAYGECATSGGPWWQSYNIIQGIDQVLPVDVYVVGCPPKPENLFAAMMKLQDKIGGKIAGNSERSVSENIRREKAGGV
jgi:hypothetical protein